MESVEAQSEPVVHLLTSHLPMLRRVVNARVPVAFVDDIVQEVVLAGAESNQFPEIQAEQQKWLCRVALRQCALFWRKQSRHSKVDSLELTEDKSLNDPIHWLIARESAQQVKLAISKLDVEFRNILMLKFVEKLTYEQLAERFQITRHAAEYRVRVAKRELQSIVQDMGLNEVDEC